MTPNEARVIIYNEIETYWPSLFDPEVPYVFDDEKFDTEGVDEYVRVTVQHTPFGGQHTLGPPGGRIFRREAVVQFQIYTAVDRGLLRLDELAKAARDLFEASTISQVMFHDSDSIENGQEDGYNRGTTTIDFSYDEKR